MKINDFSDGADKALHKLREIIRQLRSPEGCLWDRQQKKEDIARYLIDEAYEVIDAMDSGTPEAVREEMGDLLFQIFFLASIAEEEKQFTIADVMEDVTEKMIRRHPHVFGNTEVRTIEDIRLNWEDIKKRTEKKTAAGSQIMAGIPRSTPSLRRAQKMTENASKVGFDWGNADDVLVKVEEELGELKTAINSDSHIRIKEEMGDLFFSLVNLCRFLNVDAEEALKGTIIKFSDRFQYIEEKLSSRGKTPLEASLDEMDELWNESKLIEGK
jgi:tetrapyrrole methylase family protein/MazG family protein